MYILYGMKKLTQKITKDKPIVFLATSDEKQYVENLAEKSGFSSVSQFIRCCIDYYVEKEMNE